MHIFSETGWLTFCLLWEGYSVHEGINSCLSMTHAFTPKFVSHQELYVSPVQYIFSVNNTILCLI